MGKCAVWGNWMPCPKFGSGLLSSEQSTPSLSPIGTDYLGCQYIFQYWMEVDFPFIQKSLMLLAT